MGGIGESFGIGELARRTGCKPETVRWYERVRLLPAPRRSAGRFRRYDAAAARRLGFVRRARALGFTLDQIRALLALAEQGRDGCAAARRLGTEHLGEVRDKIRDLRAMERALAVTVRRCAAGATPGCAVIDALFADSHARR